MTFLVQPIHSTWVHVVLVDYAGHTWIRDDNTWTNPTTGIQRDHPKWTTQEAYRPS